MNKLIQSKYFVNKRVESDLKVKFLQPFAKHNLQKFIRLNKNFNPHHVKFFYCNLELTTAGLVSKFKNRVVKFNYIDFATHFGLKSVGMDVCVSKSSQYERIFFVQSISKYVFGDRLDMANFHISQVKFEMRILHWIIVKVFYRKPSKWGKVDDFNFYLMWDIFWVQYWLMSLVMTMCHIDLG